MRPCQKKGVKPCRCTISVLDSSIKAPCLLPSPSFPHPLDGAQKNDCRSFPYSSLPLARCCCCSLFSLFIVYSSFTSCQSSCIPLSILLHRPVIHSSNPILRIIFHLIYPPSIHLPVSTLALGMDHTRLVFLVLGEVDGDEYYSHRHRFLYYY